MKRTCNLNEIGKDFNSPKLNLKENGLSQIKKNQGKFIITTIQPVDIYKKLVH